MVEYLKKIDPNIAIFVGTTLIAFISWLIKSLIEKPLIESKSTFNKFFDKRIEILTEIKVKLSFILYFPRDDGSKEFKEQLQSLLIKDGKSCYLNKETLDSVIRLSIEPSTNKELVTRVIGEIDEDLYGQIHKVKDEIDFYKNYSNFNPFKRFIGFALLSFQYLLSFLIVISIVAIFFFLFITGSIFSKIALILLMIVILYLINKWMKK